MSFEISVKKLFSLYKNSIVKFRLIAHFFKIKTTYLDFTINLRFLAQIKIFKK